MSSPAPAPQRITNGYAQVPNSIIENQAFLTHAELSLALIVVRRGGATDDGTAVSDQTWERWTGLGARQKKYAIAGLQKKGLSVDGRGDQARYRWQPDMWASYARQREREERAKTEGRKPAAVPAKKGAMVHPACREGGCAMMQDPPAGKLVAMPTPAIDAQAWPQTLAMIRGPFPLAAAPFVARLVAVVRSSVGNVTDAELAHGVKVAYKLKSSQHSEGLFLFTVPEAIAAIRRVKIQPAPAAAGGIDRRAIDKQLDKIIGVLWDASWVPMEVTVDLGALRQLARAGDLDQIDAEMSRIEKIIIQAAHVALTDDERDQVKSRVSTEVKQYNGRMAGEQLERLATQFLERAILEHFNVPRLGLFFTVDA